MTMKTVKVVEATQLQLNWLVAKVEGKDGVLHDDGITRCIVIAAPSGVYKGTYSPSINWAQGGPILERMFEQGLRLHNAEHMTGIHDKNIMVASLDSPNGFWFGPTPLIAAMRSYVASKLGREVEVPEELS